MPFDSDPRYSDLFKRMGYRQ